MKVSIIITSYNYGQYIERAIRSCISQNFPHNQFEVIVVDDASTDGTPAQIERFCAYPNFRLIVNPENLGVAGAANAGIRAALGQFVIRLDADDFASANLLLFLSEYLEANHDAFAVACDYLVIDEHEEVVERCHAEERPISCGIMYRRDLLVRAGLYNEEFRHLEERELRARLGDYYRIHYLRIPFYRYRRHGENKTRDAEALSRFEKRIASAHPGRVPRAALPGS
jgi:glycosyltransferase involved in cell wall biosynthesis